MADPWRALADAAPAMLWVTDPSGSCTFVSRQWEECTGQLQEEARAFGWLDVVHDEDRARATGVISASIARAESFNVDFRLRQRDGTFHWVVSNGRPDFGADGTLVRYVGAVMDIDARKRAEVALRRTQQMARFLANVSAALTDMSDFRQVLRQAATLSVPFFADWCAVDIQQEDDGMERLALAHSDPSKLALAHDLARRWPPDRNDLSGPGRVLATGEIEIVEHLADPELAAWARDDEHRALLRKVGLASYLCAPVTWRQKTRAVLTFAVGAADRGYTAADQAVAEDLARRAAIAIENGILYHTAVEADRRKDEFLAVLSHELRTPLNAIVGWSHILRDTRTTPEIVQKAAETIHRNAQVQAQLISDILDVSRIAAGKLRLDVRSIDLPPIVEAALESLRPAAAARGVRLETVLDPRAGPISGDAGRLQQIIGNLVSNAVKFVPEKTGRVHIRLEAINSHIRLIVEDNGPGIEPAFLPHVFERFRQAESSSRRGHQGVGLGLAIVRQLVELHGGTVRAENRAERSGAVFTVEIPRRSISGTVTREVPAERHPTAKEPLWLDATTPSLQGLRVLVIDDQADAREVVRTVLERCGADVTVAGCARDGLHLVRLNRPHVVLSDIEMPEESGYDFVRALRQMPAEEGGLTPVIALTAYATAHDRVQILREGFQMHVPKPVEPAELVAIVASLAIRPRP